MVRLLPPTLFAALLLVAACKATTDTSQPVTPDRTGGTGGGSAGRGGGAGAAGSAGSGGQTSPPGAGSGGSAPGTGGAGGAGAGGTGTGGTGGSVTPGTGGSLATGGTTGGGGSGGARDAPAMPDAPSSADVRATEAGGPPGGDSDHLTGRPDLKICKKEWTAAQCCEFLCSCLGTICADSAKGKPGIASCMTWCPKLSDMARRCHVYHCYVSISPTGGIKDHDSHCGHAADQVAGGGCPEEVYK
jgi:hypothetical protein